MRESAHYLFHLVVLAHVLSVNSVFESSGDRVAGVAGEQVDSVLLRGALVTLLSVYIRLICFKQLKNGAGQAPLIGGSVVLILQ